MKKVNNEAMRHSVNEIIDHNSTVLALKSDVSVLKSDVSVLKSDVSVLKHDVHHLTLIQEQMQTDIKLILDAVIPAQKRAEKIDVLTNDIENHEVRITTVEMAMKEHLRDKAKHGS